MRFDFIQLDTAAPKQPEARILIVYTGGTFGMRHDSSGTLLPFDFREILSEIPYLKSFNLLIQVIAFKDPIDSSNVKPEHWNVIGDIIYEHYTEFDGFVILHGTDTMAYTASAVSFMLEDISKPVIFTGAQLPITAPRTDGRENLITALEIASAKSNGNARVPEVCIFFNNLLIRGNRAKKVESMHFDAFESENYPQLAKSGVAIEYNQPYIMKFKNDAEIKISHSWDGNVTFIKLFPGISHKIIEKVLQTDGLRGVVLETYGSGNAPTDKWFLDLFKESIEKGLVVFNVSQCLGGKVIQGKYETSRKLRDIGIIGGNDITSEAAVTKMMYLFGKYKDVEKVKKSLGVSLRGEMSL